MVNTFDYGYAKGTQCSLIFTLELYLESKINIYEMVRDVKTMFFYFKHRPCLINKQFVKTFIHIDHFKTGIS